jgi:hypothetical protein
MGACAGRAGFSLPCFRISLSSSAKTYHGTDDPAFLLAALRMNIAHRLPLTRSIGLRRRSGSSGHTPAVVDRMIAITAGLSAGTVGKVRRRSTVHNAQSTTRVGKDGPVRPIDSAVGNLAAYSRVRCGPCIRRFALFVRVERSHLDRSLTWLIPESTAVKLAITKIIEHFFVYMPRSRSWRGNGSRQHRSQSS